MRKLFGSIVLMVTALFVFGLLMPAPVTAAKAKEKAKPTIGYVDRQQVFASYPGIQDVMNRMQSMRDEAQKDYDTNAKNLPQAEKQAYSERLVRQQAQKEAELMKPVSEKIEASIQAVAEEKGLAAVIEAEVVIHGGIDITADVIAKVKK